MAAAATKAHRLSIFLSNRYAYAQAIRAADGHVVASASTLQKGVAEGLGSTVDTAACAKVGATLAQRLRAAGIDAIHWQRKRPQQRYHGRIKSLVDSLGAAGVKLV